MTPDFANTRLQTAHIVSECWREVLGLATVDPSRNFFEVGGNSVHAIVLHTKLRERLPACEFSVMTIFQHPTIAEFLEAIIPAGVTSGGSSPAPGGAGPTAQVSAPAGPRGAAPLSALERAHRQQQQAAGGRPPWAAAKP